MRIAASAPGALLLSEPQMRPLSAETAGLAVSSLSSHGQGLVVRLVREYASALNEALAGPLIEAFQSQMSVARVAVAGALECAKSLRAFLPSANSRDV